jgi:adenylylsulfate kinase
LVDELRQSGRAAVRLESDALRAILEKTPDYSPQGRDRFYAILSDLAALLVGQGLDVVVDATAPRRAYRERLRARVPDMLEVLVDAPLAVREGRDPKGLYRRAREGSAPDLPGATGPYEAPLRPDLALSGTEPPRESAARIVDRLRGRPQR